MLWLMLSNDSLIERSLASLFARNDASGRVRLGTLATIFWVAILGQLTTILVARQALDRRGSKVPPTDEIAFHPRHAQVLGEHVHD